MNAIEIKDLAIGYRGKAILSDLSLSLQTGKVTAMIGRNGVGKSTLIKTMTGHLAPIAGEVRVEGELLSRLGRKELAKKIAEVTTERNMAGGLRLEELVGLGRTPHTGFLGRMTPLDRMAVEDAMMAVGIHALRHRFVSELSDGERQKGMIARGLVQETPIIIMDEPFSFLDVGSRIELLHTTVNLAHQMGKAILFSTHEVADALRLCDRIWLFTGDGITDGTPSELMESEALGGMFVDKNVVFDKGKGDFVKKI
ncbi:MAG: ABC transporter ATP-binding protein [Muribaculaceae bacterium]|nr:ABC transporter ATP-binding protein [Muribaculaceae bacterium]